MKPELTNKRHDNRALSIPCSVAFYGGKSWSRGSMRRCDLQVERTSSTAAVQRRRYDRSFTFDIKPLMPARESSRKELAICKQHETHSRRVRFASHCRDDQVSSAVSDVFVYPAVPKELLGLCFWSQHEIELFRRAQNQLVRALHMTIGDKLSNAIMLLHGFRKEFQGQSDNESDEQGALNILAASSLRGLEQHFKTYDHYKRRRWGVRKILSLQESCQDCDSNHLETLLRSWSLKISAPYTRCAIMLARVDEASAKDYIKPAG